MKIAVIGAGFAGLSVCWHLLHFLNSNNVHIDIIDAKGIGGGASGIAAGLLHAFGGTQAKKSWMADIVIKEALHLIKASEISLGQSVIAMHGMLRPALNEEQQSDYYQCAVSHSEISWWSPRECQERFSKLEPLYGLYVPQAVAVDARLYLDGLFAACKAKGAALLNAHINCLEDLKEYDCSILACGAHITKIKQAQRLPIRPLKGQILELNWLYDESLPFALNAKGYLMRSGDKRRCIAGATFERDYSSELPDVSIAEPIIRNKIAQYSQELSLLPLIDCRSGIRGTTASRLPLLGKLSHNCYFIAGLGSKGLLYHAWAGKLLAQAIAEDSWQSIPNALILKSTD